MDCGSGWQPDLPPFAQRRDGRIGYTLPDAGTVAGSAAAQLFKMKLVHTATIALRNCNQVIIDLDLLALFRQVTKQMRDVTANGAHVRALQF
jgi:hypothetical protein